MMQDDRIVRRLRGAPFPEPTLALRQRVLAAATAHARPAVTWADRVWFSSRWRFAAIVLLVGLVGLDRLSVVSRGSASEGPATAAVQASQAVEQAAMQAGMPRDQADALARRALIAASRPAQPRNLWLDLAPVESGFSRIDLREPD